MKAEPNQKLTVLFVGAFTAKRADGATGGVISASLGLFESPISEHVDWVPIDSTSTSVPPPPLGVRARRAAGRVVRFAWLLIRRRIDLAYILTSDGGSFIEKGLMSLLARLRGVPVILNPRSGMTPDDYERSRFMHWYIPFVLSRCTRVMCQGSQYRDFYASILGTDDRLVVVPNWIDLRGIPERTGPPPSADRPLRILYLGWVERFKGIFDLIDAFKRAGDLNAVVAVCGKGSHLEEARAYAESLGLADRFDFRGWVTGEAKWELLADIDLYVHPSHREGMPNALLEAMACGIPPIASRAGAIPDIIHDASVGMLFDAGDVQSLADALVALTGDAERRHEIGRAARRRIEENHGLDASWPRVLDVFRSAAGQP